MTVHFIGAGPGAPDLITVRGFRLIESCPICLYAGSLVPAALVAAAPKGARIVDTAPLTLDEIIAEMAAADAAGPHVARIPFRDIALYGAGAQPERPPDAVRLAYDLSPGVAPLAPAGAA